MMWPIRWTGYGAVSGIQFCKPPWRIRMRSYSQHDPVSSLMTESTLEWVPTQQHWSLSKKINLLATKCLGTVFLQIFTVNYKKYVCGVLVVVSFFCQSKNHLRLLIHEFLFTKKARKRSFSFLFAKFSVDNWSLLTFSLYIIYTLSNTISPLSFEARNIITFSPYTVGLTYIMRK